MERLLEIEGEWGGRGLTRRRRARSIWIWCCTETEIIEEDGLSVPHPRFREREFVLRPLAEIAPEMVDPITGTTISELLNRMVGE